MYSRAAFGNSRPATASRYTNLLLSIK
jgi:hypothetical protein